MRQLQKSDNDIIAEIYDVIFGFPVFTRYVYQNPAELNIVFSI